MKHNSTPQEKTLTHIYVRDAQKGFLRPCWSTGTEIYCGMCMRGAVEDKIGASCPVCSSVVERILEVEQGGAPRLGRRRREVSIRVGEARQQAQRADSAVLLDFQDSRRVGA